MTALRFRRLTEADLPMLHEWLNRPHVAEWWDGPLTLDEVQAEVGPELDNPKNARAIACYRKVGFQDAGLVDTPDGPAHLMTLLRA